MKIFYEGRVEPAHIDNLGHMNVRIYGMKAATATRALSGALGLDQAALTRIGAALAIVDTHTRFYREQLEGAPLAVRAGILSATPEALELYLELINRDSGDLSATLRSVAKLVHHTERTPLALPPGVVEAADSMRVEWPDYGRPRSLSLDPVRTDITLAEVERLGIPSRFDPYVVQPEDCDADGFFDLAAGRSIAFLSLPIRHNRRPNPMGADVVGIATVESRQVIVNAPRQDERLVTHSTCTEVQEKLVKFRDWTFEAASGQLVAVVSTAGLGFDTEQRKSVPFPPAMHVRMEAMLHTELV